MSSEHATLSTQPSRGVKICMAGRAWQQRQRQRQRQRQGYHSAAVPQRSGKLWGKRRVCSHKYLWCYSMRQPAAPWYGVATCPLLHCGCHLQRAFLHLLHLASCSKQSKLNRGGPRTAGLATVLCLVPCFQPHAVHGLGAIATVCFRMRSVSPTPRPMRYCFGLGKASHVRPGQRPSYCPAQFARAGTRNCVAARVPAEFLHGCL